MRVEQERSISMDITSKLANVSLVIKGNNEHENPTGDAMNVDNTKTLISSPHAGSSLPPEILFSILPRAIPPYTLLDTTMSAGDNSTWCQTLHLIQSVILVCRGWYDVGIVFLYENVCIRRGHQLESFRRTLTSSPAKDLSSLVKSLTIQCYIPEDMALNFRADLDTVVDCCASLSTFAYMARFVAPAPVMLIYFPPNITHFRLEGDFDPGQLFVILMQLKETLLSFHLMIWDEDLEQYMDGRNVHSKLRLSSLQFLSVTILKSERFAVLNILRDQLVMPSLQKLTIAGYDFFHSGSEPCDWDLQTAIVTFLLVHGYQLRQLHVHGFRFVPETFKRILKLCPQLERIILHASTLLRLYWSNSDLDDFGHPTLRWIDFTHYLRDSDIYPSSELCLSKKNLPALERVRRFCNFPGELLKWLDECPPNAGAETEEFVIGVFQHQLDCREGLFVWRFERDVLEDALELGDNKGCFLEFSGSFTAWKDSNTDSDSDYQLTSSDDCDTSSSTDLEYDWSGEDGGQTSEEEDDVLPG